MSILPKLTYTRFRVVPVKIIADYIMEINKLLLNFI